MPPLTPKALASLPRDDEGSWQRRQHECDSWYSGLARDPGAATGCFRQDYGAYSAMLASLRGNVVDVGGGNGVARHYLAEGVSYVCVEPSMAWLGAEWTALAASFPCLATWPRLVRGVGESLPLRSRSFDAALSLWSLNHARDPAEMLREVARVLRPAGRFLLVLEDMAPSWTDFLDPGFWNGGARRAPALLRTKLHCLMTRRAWPVQSDHLPIQDGQLVAWLSRYFEIVRRAWVGGYLSYELLAR